MNNMQNGGENSPQAASFAALVQQRHSCRAFAPTPLPQMLVERMFRMAQQAPSDCNTQCWQIYLAEGARLERLRSALRDRAQTNAPSDCDVAPVTGYQDVYLERRRACGWGLYAAIGIAKGDRQASRRQAMRNFDLFDAPHLAVITAHSSLGPRGLFDAGIYTGYLLLAAQALGVGAVPQAAVSHHAGLLHDLLEIPADCNVVCAVSFGQALPDRPENLFRTAREDIANVVHLRR